MTRALIYLFSVVLFGNFLLASSKVCPKSVACTDPNSIFRNYTKTPASDVCGSNTVDCRPIARCYCKYGYCASGGGCVVDKTAPPPQACLDDNEEFLQCGAEIFCSNGAKTVVADSVGKCLCRPGYCRNNIFGCSSIQTFQTQAAACADPNAIFRNVTKTSVTDVCGSKSIDCKENQRCACRFGYCANGGVCVADPKAPQPQQCNDPNQEFLQCGSEIDCSTGQSSGVIADSKGRCFCRPGYCKNKIFGCSNIQTLQTTQAVDCSDPNAIFRNYTKTPFSDTCRSGEVQCTKNPRCYCKYRYCASGGRCVVDSSVPPPPTCLDSNEEFLQCGSETDCATGRSTTIADTNGRCLCRPGYCRNNIFGCSKIGALQIQAGECPNDDNAIFRNATKTPASDVCNSGAVDCRINPRCGCKFGYCLNGGRCIADLTAPAPKPCNDPNQEFLQCGSEIDCSTGRSSGPIADTDGRCFCRPGYCKNKIFGCSKIGTVQTQIDECPDTNAILRNFTKSATSDACNSNSINCNIDRKCSCKYGYCAKGGSCVVDPKALPPKSCPDPNQEFLQCGSEIDCGTGRANFKADNRGLCFCRPGFCGNGGGCVKR